MATMCTKTAKPMRQSRKHASSDILFDKTMTSMIYKEKIFVNPKNKGWLLSMMIEKFSSANINATKQQKTRTP